jgi:hypothetical protein
VVGWGGGMSTSWDRFLIFFPSYAKNYDQINISGFDTVNKIKNTKNLSIPKTCSPEKLVL